MKYKAKVNFTFIEYEKDEPNQGSQTFELEAKNKETAFVEAFNLVIGHWDKGSIGITSIELA